MRAFGVTADGHTIHSATLSWPDGLEVQLIEYGAILHRLGVRTPSGQRQAILSLDSLSDYERDTKNVGACVGRFANRIAGGRFELDGREVQVSVNEPPNTLHGGKVGFNKRSWRIVEETPDGRAVTLAYRSPAGEEGFPGTLEVRASFTLTAADTLQIAYEASADSATPVNLSHHIYFNLLGDRAATILDHRLTIEADGFTPVGPGLIPTGAIAPVAGTPFDLRKGERLADVLAQSDPQLMLGEGVDLNWALAPGAGPALTLQAPDRATMRLTTDQPGMQVYTGQALQAPFVAYGGLALEPQGFPDAVNHAGFPDAILRPGQIYRRRSLYRFQA
ncbi:aldose epimerase family protein [Caulobacter sp. S45]|uniref:aldose epimerase family protein n=1 Tax=Caulobacter sp. S45 TaxID=1641861 RepID=UPI001576B660|nr:aldose epimerase family protein [Caulobacter sp. S45]